MILMTFSLQSVNGLLAARGGSTSHAAVCVHGIEDRPYAAVLGVPELRVRKDKATLKGANDKDESVIHVGDILSIHGQTGEVFFGSRGLLNVKPKLAT